MDSYDLTNLITSLVAIAIAATLYVITNVTRGFFITLGAMLALKLFGLLHSLGRPF